MFRLVAFLLLPLLGCASGSSTHGDSSGAVEARDLAFSHTYEVRFGSAEDVQGYIVEFFRVPEGILDRRLYPVGTVLVQNLDLVTIGFITPGSRGYAYDEHGNAIDLGFDGRNDHVIAMLGGGGRPHFTSTTPGLPADG